MESSSKIDRLKLMAEHGLNIPVFIENPHKNFGLSTFAVLKSTFMGCPKVSFYAKGNNQITEMEYNNLSSAFASSVALETKGWVVWISEVVPCVYSGTIWVDSRATGKMKWDEGSTRKTTFQNVETISSVRHKIIVRRVFNFLLQMHWKAVKIDFGWATTFCGERSERIVFFDFLPLESIS